jgi:hypothetical protein
VNARILIAVLIGALLAIGSSVVLVHDATVTRPAPTRVLFSDGSGQLRLRLTGRPRAIAPGPACPRLALGDLAVRSHRLSNRPGQGRTAALTPQGLS